MLGQRWRRWANNNPTLGQHLVLAGIALYCIHTNAVYTDLDYTQPAGEPSQHEPMIVTAHRKLTVVLLIIALTSLEAADFYYYYC